MRKLVILVSILLAVGKLRFSAADKVLSIQRSLKEQRDKESSLPPCDRKKEDVCNKDSKELFKNANDQCQKHACSYQPTVGLTQNPQLPYFKFNPSAIVASAKNILYSFKGIDGETCTFQRQPCSCRSEDKCSCSSAAKVCKQQYRVERTYFVVYNTGKKSQNSPFGGHKPNIGFIPGYAQHQTSPFGLGMISPFQQGYGSQQQSPSLPTGANLMSFGRSLLTESNEDTKKDQKPNQKRNLRYIPNAFPSSHSAPQFPDVSGNSEMQKLKALAQSLSMNQAPNGFPMGMMPPGPQPQGFGGPGPQSHGFGGPGPQSYGFGGPGPQSHGFGGYNPYQFQGPVSMPPQPPQPPYPFPQNMPFQPMSEPSQFGTYPGQQPQGYPTPSSMPPQYPNPLQQGPSPPRPSDSNDFLTYPNQPPHGGPAPGSTFPQNPNPFQQGTPPTRPSEPTDFGNHPGQLPHGYQNNHQPQTNSFGHMEPYPQQPPVRVPHGSNPYSPTRPSEPTEFGNQPGQLPHGHPNNHQPQTNSFGHMEPYPQQPPIRVPHGSNPYSPFHQGPYSPPNQHYPNHQPHNMGSHQSISMHGNSMMTSAMFRYFLMQDKTTTTSNTFLKVLPILMSNNELSKMISFESLYVMVPDGCDCENSDSEKDDDSGQKNKFPFFNPYQSPYGMMQGFQMPHSPFHSFGPPSPMNMPFQTPYIGMNPSPGHPGPPPAAFPPMGAIPYPGR